MFCILQTEDLAKRLRAVAWYIYILAHLPLLFALVHRDL